MPSVLFYFFPHFFLPYFHEIFFIAPAYFTVCTWALMEMFCTVYISDKAMHFSSHEWRVANAIRYHL